MYNVTGKARARKNIKFAKGLNNFKYLSSDYVEVLVRWEQILSDTEDKPKMWWSCKPCSVAGTGQEL